MARRYQTGTIEEISTSDGPCWYIRFSNPPGVTPQRPRFRIGPKSQFPTMARASRAAQHLRDRVNGSDEALVAPTRTFGDVIARYEREEMPARYSTRRGYMQLHRNHIMPRWGKTLVNEIRPLEVRKWLLELELSSRTRGHILGQMRVLFRSAMLWEWIPAAVNPMSLFSIAGSTKRTKKPRVINPAQFTTLLAEVHEERTRAMLIGAYCLGVRVSELFALQWHDFEFLNHRVHIRRATVEGRIGEVKTIASEAPLPLHPLVGEAFLAHYANTGQKEPTDWVFASPYRGGKLPMDSRNLQTRFLVPAGKRIGLDFSLGWHTFRHSYKVLLERAGVDVTVQRDLMRHADTHTTTQIYGEVEFDRMRTANDKAVALALRKDQ